MADDPNLQSAGTVETKAEFKAPKDFVKNWLSAIQMAGKEEEKWREDADAALKRYRAEEAKSANYNILYANTKTKLPALYNSEPVPDVRRRFNEADPIGQAVSMAIERALTVEGDLYDFDGTMKSAVQDMELQGRGISRVRVVVGPSGSRTVVCEPVIWDDYRRGPAKRRQDVPWEAFRWKLTREELVEKNPTIGREIKLDAVAGDTPEKGSEDPPDMFKRAVVWEIWDRLERRVYFIAESHTAAPLQVLGDEYELRDFFCTPKPLYSVPSTDTLKPVCEFKVWKPLADEIDTLTARISGIVRVMKFRGIYSGAFEAEFKKLSEADDGQMVPAEDAGRALANAGMDKAAWMWPVDMAIEVVQGLYEAREQCKQTIYEITGVADIMRGQTEAQETLGAQQIKAQWGSLRLQEGQRDVQRYARDLYRMKTDLMAKVYTPQDWLALTGIKLGPEHMALLKQDLQREYAIDVETDSTIRADLSRAQQNVSGFIAGLAQFAEAAQAMPPKVAIGMVRSFSRYFKLGREVDVLLDDWVKEVEQQAGQPPPKDPKVQAEEVKAQAAAQKAQADVQMVQVKAQAEQQKTQMDMQAKAAELNMQMQKLQAEMQAFMVEHQATMQANAQQAELAERQHQLAAEDQMRSQEAAEHGHGLKMEVMDAQAKAKQAAARQSNGGAE